MSFLNSCHSYAYDPEHLTLWAQCYDWNRNLKVSNIRLPAILGNHNGSFDWGSDSFDETAKYISFHHDEVILSAFLKDWDKVYQPAQVCLNDRIENDNGVLRIDRGFFGGLVADIWNLGNILIQIEKGERNVSNNIREWLEKAKYNADGIVHPP